MPAKKPTQPAKPASKTPTLASLAPNAKNPRKPWKNDEQRDAFQRSLATFGDLSGVVFNKTTKQLVGGHKRVEEFKADADATLTITEQMAKPDATGTVAYGHVTLSNGVRFAYREVKWDASKETAANLAANKWSAEWDAELLGGMLQDLSENEFDMALTGFELPEIAGFLQEPVVHGTPEHSSSGEVDVDGMQMEHTCPKCGFEFNTSKVTA